MPHIDVKMFPGRNDEIKKNLAEKLLKTACLLYTSRCV